jgi:predicted RNase H-like HicB family nuclease
MLPATDTVEVFGKIIFTPKEETYPVFPDLNVLIFKYPGDNGVYNYTAVCIQLELDACGDSVEEVKEELMQAIALYFNAQARSCNSLDEFAQKIINTIFDPSEQKKELFNVYQEVKRNYLMSRAQKSRIQMPRIEPSSVVSFLFNNNIELSPAVIAI